MLTQQHRTDLLEQLKKLKAATPAPPAGDVDATTPETEEDLAEGAIAEGVASKDAPVTEEAANEPQPKNQHPEPDPHSKKEAHAVVVHVNQSVELHAS